MTSPRRTKPGALAGRRASRPSSSERRRPTAIAAASAASAASISTATAASAAGICSAAAARAMFLVTCSSRNSRLVRRPATAPGLVRLGEVLTPEPGYELALSAALGSLVDALVASDEHTAIRAASPSDAQRTVLFPASAPVSPKPGSLIEHVTCRKGYELVARRLLGHVVVGDDVTLQGVYREDGMLRAGTDPRVEIDARRSRLRERIAGLEPKMLEGEAAGGRLKVAEAKLADLRGRAAGATRLEESERILDVARAEEEGESDRLPKLELVATATDCL